MSRIQTLDARIVNPDNEKDIEIMEIDFKNRTITCYNTKNGYYKHVGRPFKFALVSPVGLMMQGIRKFVFGHLVAETDV